MSEEDASRTDNEEDAAIDLSLLRELGKNTLINALNSVSGFDNFNLEFFTNYRTQVNGSKTLVLDPTIAGPLGLLTEVSLLKVSSSFSTLLPTEHDTRSNMA